MLRPEIATPSAGGDKRIGRPRPTAEPGSTEPPGSIDSVVIAPAPTAEAEIAEVGTREEHPSGHADPRCRAGQRIFRLRRAMGAVARPGCLLPPQPRQVPERCQPNGTQPHQAEQKYRPILMPPATQKDRQSRCRQHETDHPDMKIPINQERRRQNRQQNDGHRHQQAMYPTEDCHADRQRIEPARRRTSCPRQIQLHLLPFHLTFAKANATHWQA